MHFEISSEKLRPFFIGLNIWIAVEFPGLTYVQICEPVYDYILINWKKAIMWWENDFLKVWISIQFQTNIFDTIQSKYITTGV